MAALLKNIDIKSDMPSVEEARKRLLDELQKAKAEGFKVVKLVHGYGSSGVGGKLRDGLRSSLARRKKEGLIQAYVYGEKWSIFDPAARQLLDLFPDLKRDPDLDRENLGITLVLL